VVKIDAKGSTSTSFAGASDLFGKTDIFLVEAAVRTDGAYENSLAEVVGFMGKAGFSVVSRLGTVSAHFGLKTGKTSVGKVS
jgi:hypothetical protein